jgi:hypothetical protein
MVYLRTEYGMICAFASLSPSITFKTPFKRILRRIDATHSLTSFSSIIFVSSICVIPARIG